MSHAERTLGLEPGSFPFQSHFCAAGGANVHYVDEGQGPTLFMIHGNPTWSFLYRHVIGALRPHYRCVAIDLPGFGLSEAADGFSFRPQDQAAVVAALLARIGIDDGTLVAHDWGGPIGLAAAIAQPGRLTRFALGNTWAWPVNGDFHFEWFSRLMGGPIGRFAANRFAIFINGVMPASMRRRKLTKEEMKAYRAPFAHGRTRQPMYVFPRQITAAGDWLGELEKAVSTFKGPVRFIWPDSDIAFRDKELSHWQRIFPQASVERLAKCGHFLWEDAPEESIEALRGWLPNSGNGQTHHGAHPPSGR
jgi:haloalkane dehalogenase